MGQTRVRIVLIDKQYQIDSVTCSRHTNALIMMNITRADTITSTSREEIAAYCLRLLP